jgi:hypothetical protein
MSTPHLDFGTFGRKPLPVLTAAGALAASDGSALLRGRPENPKGFRPGDDVIKLRGCPDCKGRGWFLINPFATSPPPAGGIGNMCQCQTCASAKAYYDAHGCLPPQLVEAMEQNDQREGRAGSGTSPKPPTP